MTRQVITATDARVHFGDVLRRVREEQATFVVERNGEDQAVIISAREYERLVTQSPAPKPWSDYERELRVLQRRIATEAKGQPINVVELIHEGREERDEQLLGHLLRRERDPADAAPPSE